MSEPSIPEFPRNLTASGRHTLAGDELARKILLSARQVMVRYGAGGFSVRKVAVDAGVSLGHLQHYFPTRADLTNALVIALEEDFYDHFVAAIAVVDNPVDRFVACAEYVLNISSKNDLLPLMREFWAMAARDEAMAGSLHEFYAACRKFAARILREANADLDYEEARRRSCVAVSMLSGAFLYLDPWTGDDVQTEFREYLLTLMREMPHADTAGRQPG